MTFLEDPSLALSDYDNRLHVENSYIYNLEAIDGPFGGVQTLIREALVIDLINCLRPPLPSCDDPSCSLFQDVLFSIPF